MSRSVDTLDPRFRPIALELLAKLVEQRIYVVIVDTRRTKEEHDENVKKGVSWTTRSKHIDGLAIDLAPVSSYNGPGTTNVSWDATHPAWAIMGAIGKSLGLIWGGEWKVRDLGHFELP